MKKTSNFSKILTLLLFFSLASAVKANAQYYSLRIYHLKTKAQEERLDNFLKDALLPTLHRSGGQKAGVFKTMDNDTTGKKVYVFIPFEHWDTFENMEKYLMVDKKYLSEGKDFLEAPYNDLPYERMETIALKAFWSWTKATVPKLKAKKSDRVYELRSYESPTINYGQNKIDMFNNGGEPKIFQRLGFNAVFYAEVIAGSHMPNLMYMTTFESMADREAHWKTFFDDPEWKVLSAKPKYQHNVSKVDITFLHPAEYSDF